MTDVAIAALVARDSIRRLLSLYCDAVSRREPDAIGALFMPDAVVTIAHFPDRIGRPAIIDGLRRTISKFTFLHQKCDTGLIDVAEDQAWARIGVLEINRATDSPERLNLICGTYEDEYRRDSGGWGFQRRRFTLQFRTLLQASAAEEFPPFVPHRPFDP
jgi:hypothetical protein